MPRPIRISPEALVSVHCEAELEAQANYIREGRANAGLNCGERAPDGSFWFCTRDRGHEGPHVASGASYRRRWPYYGPRR
jgi:hypothetical protein